MRYVYVVLSSTPTLFGKTLRAVCGKRLNHASISLDEGLNEMYSFARHKLHTPLVGGLVKENFDRLSLGGKYHVHVKIYKISVSDAQYERIAHYIYSVRDDEEQYLYNLFAIVGYPFHKGYNVYKAYVCSEFVVRTLLAGRVSMRNGATFRIQPEDIGDFIYKNLYFEGSLSEYVSRVNHLN
ncbi:MAG: hypothetical protein LBH54_03800, partial [Clostridiales bacterium]|nr:hypothetical protein [Clostridiales bacterium]